MNTQLYDKEWLLQKYYNGDDLHYLFFWGHRGNSASEISKSCLSQWFELPFFVAGTTYQTAEQWMMANKALVFNDLKTYRKIIEADRPGEAKKLGRQVIGFDEQTWNAGRYDIVMRGNIHKFNQHPQYASYLLSTNDLILVEASPLDTTWGIGISEGNEAIYHPTDWNGLNLLGFALMEVRDFLREFGHFDSFSHPVELPWTMHSNSDPMDLFWRMGKGENILLAFGKHYLSLSERDKVIFKLNNPAPFNWQNFYD
jgi:ribA/ribD-fused uncharacterized protein